MKLIEDLVSRKIWCVIICLFPAFIISVGGTTTSECNDFGLRNIIDDEGDWTFYTFTDLPCLICLDGRRMSSFNALLTLPCRHPDQPEGSRVIVTYRVRVNQTDVRLRDLGTHEQCETDNSHSTGLTGEPVMLDEMFLGSGDGIQLLLRAFVPWKGHLLKPSIDFPEHSVICIEKVDYENVRLANDTTTVGGATPSECNDFGLRNIIDDEGDWLFYTFTDQPCLICLDGRRMSSFNALLILPCRHSDQPEGSRLSVNYRVRRNETGVSIIGLDTNDQCETENALATELTGQPVMLNELFHGGNILRLTVGFIVIPKTQYLLKPSTDFPEHSIICIEKVTYENVKLANDTTIGTTPPRAPTTAAESTTSLKSPAREGTTPTRTPTTATKLTTFSTLPDPSKGISLVWVIAPLCVGIVVAFGCGFFVRSKYAPCYHRTETKKPGKDGLVLTLSEDMTTERSKRNVTGENENYAQINDNSATTSTENVSHIAHTYFQNGGSQSVYSRNIFQSNYQIDHVCNTR